MHAPRTAAVASLAAAGFLLAGCGGSAGAKAAPPDRSQAFASALAAAPMPSVSVTTTAPSDTGTLVLPIEQYLFTPAQDAVLNEAVQHATQQCMAAFGYTVRLPPPLTHQYGGGLVPLRYGPSDPAEAARDGYHRAPDPDKAAQDDAQYSPKNQLDDAGLKIFAGTGAPVKVGGLTVAPDGCHGESVRKIALGGQYGESGTARQIVGASYAKSEADSRVQAAEQAWSGCMRQKGFSYRTPDDAFSDAKWTGSDTASAAEIQTAVADVACKQQTNLVGVWFSVEAAFQQQQIAANAATLAADKEHMDAEMKAAVGQ